MKVFTTVLFLFFGLSFYAQNLGEGTRFFIEKDTLEIKLLLDRLKTQDSVDAATEILKMDYELLSFDLDNPIPPQKLIGLQQGEHIAIVEKDITYVYYFFQVEEFEEYRASYIYLDGTKLSKSEVDSIRPIIIENFKSGISFEDLNEKYNMDPNPNKGDLGWFPGGQMMSDFEKAVKEHRLNEIFTVDIPEKNWYYVTLKTFKNRINKKRTYVKIKSSS
ncbi:MAG: peptidylprolyl isomerase [Bacteroidota bacterium]